MVCVGFRQAGWRICTVLHLQYPTGCPHGHIGFLREIGISLISLPLCVSFWVFILTYFPECKHSRCQVMVAQAYSSCHSEMHVMNGVGRFFVVDVLLRSESSCVQEVCHDS